MNDDSYKPVINIFYDSVFKAVFTKDTPQSRGALARLISAMIGRTLEVLEVIANDQPIDDVRDRAIRYDINCKVPGSGELINVEMTLSPDIDEVLRTEYYVSELYSSQSIKNDTKGSDTKGSNKEEKRKKKSYKDLKRTYQISFIVNNPFYSRKPLFADEEFFHEFQYYDAERGIALGGRTRIIIVELSKLDKALKKEVSEMTEKERWALYFKYNGEEDKQGLISEILKEEEGIAMAQEEYMTITRDERERARLRSELKYILDKQSSEAVAEELLEEAREQARQEQERANQEREQARRERERANQERERALTAEKNLAEERKRTITAMRALGISDTDIARIYPEA
jgi:hypothetical protein